MVTALGGSLGHPFIGHRGRRGDGELGCEQSVNGGCDRCTKRAGPDLDRGSARVERGTWHARLGPRGLGLYAGLGRAGAGDGGGERRLEMGDGPDRRGPAVGD